MLVVFSSTPRAYARARSWFTLCAVTQFRFIHQSRTNDVINENYVFDNRMISKPGRCAIVDSKRVGPGGRVRVRACLRA